MRSRYAGTALILALLYVLSLPAYDHSIFKYTTLAACIFAAILRFQLPRQTLLPWLSQPTPRPATHSRRYLLLGAFLITATLSYLEWQQPYYFTQEDTHTIFFPTILYSARGLFDQLTFPTWNGYLLLGSPTASFGFYALTYPLTYVSYAAARFLMGNEYLTMEAFAYIHLLAGYALTFAMLRTLHIRPSIAAAASICFVLLGYNLIAGRSWYYMLPTVLWLPALGLSLAHYMQNRITPRWTLLTALSIGLYFHSGNVQMWCYAMLFYGLAMLFTLALKPEKQLSHLLLAAFLGILITLPLAIPQALESQNLPRAQLNVTIAHGLSNLLLPWPLARSRATWSDFSYSGTLYFSGAIFTFFFFLKCALLLATTSKTSLRPQLCFPLLAILAIILALGTQAHLWSLLAATPPFSKFRMPFRLLPFVTFFLIVSGALMAETTLRQLPRRLWEYLLAGTATALSIYNAILCIASFDYCPDHPYPELLPSLKPFQAEGFTTTGRIYPMAQLRWYIPGHPQTQILSYPALYNIPVPTGTYVGSADATTPGLLQAAALYAQNRSEYYREYGIQYILVSKLPGQLDLLTPTDLKALRQTASEVIDAEAADAYNITTEKTKPMAYPESSPTTALPYHILPNGVDIDLQTASPPLTTRIVANFLYRPWLTATDDTGKPLPLTSDAYGRAAITQLRPSHHLHLRYTPPWFYGLYACLTAALIAAALTATRRYHAKNKIGKNVSR